MELHFLRPYWFFALILLFYLCWRLSKYSLADNWRFVCDEHLLPHLLVQSSKKFNLPLFVLGLGGVIAIISLAGPSFEKQLQPIYRSQLGRVLVLNLSPSMADSIGTTKKIDRARFKMLDYLNRQKEGVTGLVVYTDEAHIISPLTEDNRTIANFIPFLDPTIMPTYNDDTPTGLKEAGKLLKQAGLTQGQIILITDKITDLNAATKVASMLENEGYHLHIFDLSAESATHKTMQKLAIAGGGNVISLTPNNNDIDELLSKTKAGAFVPPAKKNEAKGLVWQDDGRVFALFLLPLALIAFRKGYL